MLDKVRLRNTLRKLRRIAIDGRDRACVAMAAQETLDYLAMVSGIKPVYLLGRGFDIEPWVRGVRRIANDMNLHVIEGPKWEAQSAHVNLPDWYAEYNRAKVAADPAVFYICRTKAIAESLTECCTTGRITMEEESGFLGYPLCCVRDHYRRSELFGRAFYMLLERTAGGNAEEMRRILKEDIQMTADGAERDLFDEAQPRPSAIFTSFSMCSECARGTDSPANRLSARYRELALSFSDAGLMADLALYHPGI